MKTLPVTAKIVTAAFAFGLLLAACSTPAEDAARLNAQRAADKAECAELGFKPGTEGFANCLLKLREIRAEERNTKALRNYNRYPPFFAHPYYRRYPYFY